MSQEDVSVKQHVHILGPGTETTTWKAAVMNYCCKVHLWFSCHDMLKCTWCFSFLWFLSKFIFRFVFFCFTIADVYLRWCYYINLFRYDSVMTHILTQNSDTYMMSDVSEVMFSDILNYCVHLFVLGFSLSVSLTLPYYFWQSWKNQKNPDHKIKDGYSYTSTANKTVNCFLPPLSFLYPIKSVTRTVNLWWHVL